MTGRRGNFGGANKKPGGMQYQNRNRFGAGGGGGGGGGGHQSNSFMNNVSPWLPQNNSGGMGNYDRNYSSDPQAQLALASNLLNNLLGPAASQLNKFAQPPSLLSLGGNSNSYGGSSFNRDRFGVPRSNQGKVQKRGDFKNFNNKNKRFGNERKNQSPKKDQTNKKVTGEKNAEKKDIGKNEENKVENTDLDQSVSDEKSGNDLAGASADNDKESQKQADDEPKVSYSEVPFALLYCHICRKHMWDDASFEKHLEGKPHKMMVDELERTYELKVALLRHEMRVMEHQRENDIQRAFRKGKNKVKMLQRGFCTMCDLNFLGMLPAHRKNERHQRLKKFLHPKCSACTKEFYTRLEWDEHKLSAAHLKKLAEIRKETRPDLENTEFDIIDFIEDANEELEAEVIEIKVIGKRENVEELMAVKTESNEIKTEPNEENPELDSEKSESNAENVDSSADSKMADPESNAEKPEEESKNEEAVMKEENEKEEKGEEIDESEKLPKYVAGVPVGENFLTEKKGYLCRACNRFMLSREDNKIHCQTITHYNNIIKILKAQNKIISNKRRFNVAKNEGEEKADGENDSVNENAAKRQKLDDSTTTVNGDVLETEVKEEPGADESVDKYDPEDAESESEKDNEKVSNEDASNEKVSNEDASNEDASNEDASNEDASNEKVSNEKVAIENDSNESDKPDEKMEVSEEVKKEVTVEITKVEESTPEPVKEEKKSGRPSRARRGRRT